jgi:acetylornithine deacetylase/succinyl-diaminopimelate desuccinylase-like protein
MPGGFPTMRGAPRYALTEEDRAAIAAAIDEDELVALALELGNIPSPSGKELEVANRVHDWMAREGFSPRKVGATPERPNIIGTYGGKGSADGIGKNLLFTAHLDTEAPTWNADLDAYQFSPETIANPEWEKCWLEDGRLYGFPIANDRGPMTCFLIAAKALRKAGIELAGKMYLTACPGEIGPEPIEEHRGVAYMGKDIGAHYLFHHGGIAPDYAIAAEGCDFGLTWVGCGYAVFRLQVWGEGVFTPLITHPETAAQHPNPIYRIGKVTDAIHAWSRRWDADSRYDSPGGKAEPKSQLASVRGGIPFAFGSGTEVVNLYLEVGLSPRQRAADVQHSLEAMVRDNGLGRIDIEPVVVRHGFEADATEVSPLVCAVDQATRLSLGHPVALASAVYSSMWRDHNVFNMQRIPAITTGFTRWRPTPKDLVDSALVYALTALAICGRASADTGPARSSSAIYPDKPFGAD